jgi:hypothetical protein
VFWVLQGHALREGNRDDQFHHLIFKYRFLRVSKVGREGVVCAVEFNVGGEQWSLVDEVSITEYTRCDTG